jgi:hypothetical protein
MYTVYIFIFTVKHKHGIIWSRVKVPSGALFPGERGLPMAVNNGLLQGKGSASTGEEIALESDELKTPGWDQRSGFSWL